MARIIVVEDESEVLNVVKRILETAGHQVTGAVDLAQARELLAQSPFEVAVVDHQLPDGSGLELLGELRYTRPRCARLLVSGRLDLSLAMEAVNRGEVGQVLAKPFAAADLVDAVKASIIGQRRRVADTVLQMTSVIGERSILEQSLRGPDFQLAVQPIVTARSFEVIGYEALMRCRHPDYTSPRRLLEVAERNAMVLEVGRAVAGAATRLLPHLPARTCLFLNLHPEELADMDALVDRLSPLEAGRVVLEITSQALERWPRQLRSRLDRLRDMGFRFAIDDIGAGGRALLLLAETEPVFVKIDLSIVRGIDAEPRKRRLVELLSRFAEATGSQLIGVGVETPAEAAVLKEVGVGLMQGYLFGRPSIDLSAAA